MGTRHLIVVKKDNKNSIAQYGQWDGYPEGQGRDILRFLQDKKAVNKLRESLSKIRFIDGKRDKDFLDSYDKNAPKWSNDLDNRTPEQIRWFETYMTRDLGANILSNIANSEDNEILLRNETEFAKDTLFCEYAYIIDFDKNTYEVYEDGFEKLLASYSLDKLPSEAEICKLGKEEDED